MSRTTQRHIPATLAALVVLLQIAWPLTAGTGRDAVTVVTVITFAAASLGHAAVWRGVGYAVRLAAVAGGVGLVAELAGSATGVPFGRYHYGDRLGPALADVPLVIPLAWVMMAYPAAVLARRIAASRGARALVGAAALAAWDLFLDPQMVWEGYWSWTAAGPFAVQGVPVTNFVGWFAVGAVITWLLDAPAAADDRVPVLLYAWTWASSLLAHAAFFSLETSALYGGVAMGAVLAAYAARSLQAPARAEAAGSEDTWTR